MCEAVALGFGRQGCSRFLVSCVGLTGRGVLFVLRDHVQHCPAYCNSSLYTVSLTVCIKPLCVLGSKTDFQISCKRVCRFWSSSGVFPFLAHCFTVLSLFASPKKIIPQVDSKMQEEKHKKALCKTLNFRVPKTIIKLLFRVFSSENSRKFTKSAYLLHFQK